MIYWCVAEDTKVEKKTSDPDSDSSLPSLEDEKENKTDKKKMKKSVKKDESTRKPKVTVRRN